MPTPTPYMSQYLPTGPLSGIPESPNDTIRHLFRPRRPSTSSACSESDWRAETERYFEYLIRKFPGDQTKLLSAKQMLLANDVDLKAYKRLDHGTFEKWDIS